MNDAIKTCFYIAIMVLTTNLVRVLPLTLIRKPITNTFIKSFLYYVPYVTLSVMTFPAILNATGNQIFGALALAAGTIAAYMGLGLLPVSVISCVVVFVLELFI